MTSIHFQNPDVELAFVVDPSVPEGQARINPATLIAIQAKLIDSVGGMTVRFKPPNEGT